MADILVADRSWPLPQLEELQNEGHNLLVWSEEHDRMRERANDLYDMMADNGGVDAILLAPSVLVNDALVDAATKGDPSRPFAVGSMTAGYNHIDLKTAARPNVYISYAPGETDGAVARYAVTLTGVVMRGIHRHEAAVRSGTHRTFSAFEDIGRNPSDATIGIIGAGRTGLRTAVELKRVYEGCTVIHHSATTKEKGYNDVRAGIPSIPLEQLLEKSDIVSVHAPLTESTRGMCDEAFFAQMAPNEKRAEAGVFFNFGRGDIVDQDALLRALERGDVADAALDVTTPEPLAPDHPLVQHPGCIVLPHIGSAERKTREAMAQSAVDNVINFFRIGHMLTPLVVSAA